MGSMVGGLRRGGFRPILRVGKAREKKWYGVQSRNRIESLAVKSVNADQRSGPDVRCVNPSPARTFVTPVHVSCKGIRKILIRPGGEAVKQPPTAPKGDRLPLALAIVGMVLFLGAVATWL